MFVTIEMNVYTNAPAEPGIWCLRVQRDMITVPRQGDWIELAEGWASMRVKDVTFMVDGDVIVKLDAVKTNNPELLAEKHDLANQYQWKWIGKPPAII